MRFKKVTWFETNGLYDVPLNPVITPFKNRKFMALFRFIWFVHP